MVSTKRAGGASSPMPAVQVGPSVSSPSVSKGGFSSPARSLNHGSSSSSSNVPKYIESERVLCYEPDPTKVKVVYDAKILQVRSQNTVTEYLVHFQGWNSSWDRFVPEDFLLKDIPENRELQKQLVAEAEEARLLMSKSKKKKKKSKIRRSSTTQGEERVNGEATVVPKTEVVCDGDANLLKNNQPQPQTPQHHHRSSPKKKKKKKKEKGEKLLVPEIIAANRNSEPKVDKIVIVNGTITSPSHLNRSSMTPSMTTSSASSSPKPASPFRNLSSPLPPPLRSASPKFTPKIEATTTPPNNNIVVATPEDQTTTSANRQRKRKLSVENKNLKTSGKRLKSNNPITKYFSSTPAPPIPVPTTLTFNKNCSGPKVREEKSQQQKQNLPVSNNAKKRESLTGYPSINLSDNLKRHLSSDFESVTKKRRLNKIPAEPNIVTVLEDFVRHYAAGRLVAFEKHQRKSMYTAYKRDAGEMTYQRALEAIQMCKEVAEGLRVLIDFSLQRSLLYASAGELEQFHEVMTSGVGARAPPTQLDSNASEHGHQDMEVAIFNGSSPTVSSVDSAPSHTCTKTSARLRKSDVLTSTHVTDQDDAAAVTPSKRRHTTNNSLSRRASCDTTVTANFHFFCGANAASTRSSTASNKDGGGSSCSTNSRSTATNRTSLLMPPAASSPSTPAANKVMRSVESWKLVPQSLYRNNPPLPSLVYGPIHLLRLFVKMPEILGRMPLPPKTCKLIVKYMDAVLEYFEGHQDLFAPEVTHE